MKWMDPRGVSALDGHAHDDSLLLGRKQATVRITSATYGPFCAADLKHDQSRARPFDLE
jgi:hypothetical protein